MVFPPDSGYCTVTIQTNNQKGPILTREQYNIHKQEGTVYNPNSEGNIAKFTMMRNFSSCFVLPDCVICNALS
jgi:hypothetical protein